MQASDSRQFSSLTSFLFSDSRVAEGARAVFSRLFNTLLPPGLSQEDRDQILPSVMNLGRWEQIQALWHTTSQQSSYDQNILGVIELLTCPIMLPVLENKTEVEYARFVNSFCDYFDRETFAKACENFSRILFFLDDVFFLEKHSPKGLIDQAEILDKSANLDAARSSVESAVNPINKYLIEAFFFLFACNTIDSILTETGELNDAYRDQENKYFLFLQKLRECGKNPMLASRILGKAPPSEQGAETFYECHVKTTPSANSFPASTSTPVCQSVEVRVSAGGSGVRELTPAPSPAFPRVASFSSDLSAKVLEFLKQVRSKEQRKFFLMIAREKREEWFTQEEKTVYKEHSFPNLALKYIKFLCNYGVQDITWSQHSVDYYFLSRRWMSAIEVLARDGVILKPEHFCMLKEEFAACSSEGSREVPPRVGPGENMPLKRFLEWWDPSFQGERKNNLKIICGVEASKDLKTLKDEKGVDNFIDKFPRSILVSPFFQEFLRMIWRKYQKDEALLDYFISECRSRYSGVISFFGVVSEHRAAQFAVISLRDMPEEQESNTLIPLPIMVLESFLQQEAYVRWVCVKEGWKLWKDSSCEVRDDLLEVLNSLSPFRKEKVLLILEILKDQYPLDIVIEYSNFILGFVIQIVQSSFPFHIFDAAIFLLFLRLKHIQGLDYFKVLFSMGPSLDTLIYLTNFILTAHRNVSLHGLLYILDFDEPNTLKWLIDSPESNRRVLLVIHLLEIFEAFVQVENNPPSFNKFLFFCEIFEKHIPEMLERTRPPFFSSQTILSFVGLFCCLMERLENNSASEFNTGLDRIFSQLLACPRLRNYFTRIELTLRELPRISINEFLSLIEFANGVFENSLDEAAKGELLESVFSTFHIPFLNLPNGREEALPTISSPSSSVTVVSVFAEPEEEGSASSGPPSPVADPP